MSNIIVRHRTHFTLIDFLKVFDESPLQDLAKIQQDRCHLWSVRFESKAVQNRAKICCNYGLPDPYEFIPEAFHITLRIYTLITLLRIAHYVMDNITHEWLNANLHQFKKKI